MPFEVSVTMEGSESRRPWLLVLAFLAITRALPSETRLL